MLDTNGRADVVVTGFVLMFRVQEVYGSIMMCCGLRCWCSDEERDRDLM